MSQRDQEVPTRHFAAGSARTGSDCVVVTGASFGIGAEAVIHPKPEIYTSAGLKAHALAYAEDPEARDALMRPVAETILGR